MFKLLEQVRIPTLDLPVEARRKLWFKPFMQSYLVVFIGYLTMYLIRKNFNDFDIVPADLNGQPVLRLAMTPAKLAEIREYSIKQNLTTVRNRVNELGVAEPIVQRQGANRIVVELPGVQDTAEAKRILGKTANLEFRLQAEVDAPRASSEFFEFREEGRPAVALERGLITDGSLSPLTRHAQAPSR